MRHPLAVLAPCLLLVAATACSGDEPASPAAPPAVQKRVCLGFETQLPTTVLRVLDSTRESDIVVTALPMQFANAQWSSSGSVLVGSDKCAGHLGLELQTRGLTVGFRSPFVPDSATLSFGYRGGDMNLGMNGAFRVVSDAGELVSLDGAVIGDVILGVTFDENTETGSLTLRGRLSEYSFEQERVVLVVGGGEFCVDNVCFSYTE